MAKAKKKKVKTKAKKAAKKKVAKRKPLKKAVKTRRKKAKAKSSVKSIKALNKKAIVPNAPIDHKIFRRAGIGAIVSLIAMVLAIIAGFVALMFTRDSRYIFNTPYVIAVSVTGVFVIISLIFYALLLKGYIKLGEILNIKLMRVAAILLLIGGIGAAVAALFFTRLIEMWPYIIIFNIIFVLLNVVAMILMGAAVLRAKEQLKGLGIALGVLYIISAVLGLTVYFITFSVIILIAIRILEAIIFFNSKKHIK